MTAPSQDHERRRETLDEVALIAGFGLLGPRGIVWGARPDVFRISALTGAAFVGEAKHTERPDARATFERLAKYAWAIRPYARRVGGLHLFAICFGLKGDGPRWRSTLLSATYEAGFISRGAGLSSVDDDAEIAWVKVSANPRPMLEHAANRG